MEKYKVILFDLDGTLSDPKEGITKSVQYALEKMDIVESDLEKLERFIGPPLHVSFADYYHFNEEEIKEAIHFYRDRFKPMGMFENKLYKNIVPMLQKLKDNRYKLIIATSKPTVFAEKILTYFEIDHFFDHVIGSNLDGSRSAKTDIIYYILNLYQEYSLKDFIMIGDRKHDIIGAKNTGIDSIAVSYGYGAIEELETSQPTYLVNSVNEIGDILVGKGVSNA